MQDAQEQKKMTIDTADEAYTRQPVDIHILKNHTIKTVDADVWFSSSLNQYGNPIYIEVKYKNSIYPAHMDEHGKVYFIRP